MFKGVHGALQRGNKTYKAPVNPGVLEVLTAENLLADEKYQQWLKGIRSFVGLPTHDYERLYLEAIVNFAELVQQLPETKSSYYSHTGGLLDHGLDRAYIALSMCRSYLLPPNVPSDFTSPKLELWLYAVFTAALLLDIGKVLVKYKVTICDRKAKEINVWDPLAGSLVAQKALHYLYAFERENRTRLQNMTTPLLARQLLEHDDSKSGGTGGFRWIASDKEVFEAWLAMLSQDQSGMDAILTVIPLAQSQTIAEYFAEANKNLVQTARFPDLDGKEPRETLSERREPQKKTKEGLFKTTTDTLSGILQAERTTYNQPEVFGGAISAAHTNATLGSIAGSVSPDLSMGIAFVEWLKRSLRDNPSLINQREAIVNRVSEGLLIDPKAFQKFIDAMRQDTNVGTAYRHVTAEAIMQQMDRLEITATAQQQAHRYSLKDQMGHVLESRSGVVVSNLYLNLLFADKLPVVREGLTREVGSAAPQQQMINAAEINKFRLKLS